MGEIRLVAGYVLANCAEAMAVPRENVAVADQCARQEKFIRERKNVLPRLVVVATMGQPRTDTAADGGPVLNFVLIVPKVPASVSAEVLSSLHFFRGRMPLYAMLSRHSH
jgi:hypothetical protein